ncbi:hypothetical protein BGZ68_001013 [Mortierella alpina]|nr:hypothetical protein BGZ68_001013 [Mortierella alpina]
MLGLTSTSSVVEPITILKSALPIGIGLASAAFLSLKLANRAGSAIDKSIPTVPVRAGDSNHDTEYYEDQSLFIARCEEQYGPVFNLHVLNQFLTVISGPLVREVFMNENFSFGDALDDITGIHALTMSITTTKRRFDNPLIHEIIRDTISPNLPLFTPRIVERLVGVFDRELGYGEHKLIKDPLLAFQDMIASAMATVFMGHEIAKNSKVIDSFTQSTQDFAQTLKGPRKDFWHTFRNRAKHGVFNPMRKHIEVLVEASTPVIQERRRLEAEAVEKGVEYERPLDILQKLLDNFEKYQLADIEDICGHLLTIILVSVHTTSDASTYVCYYLATFPEYIEPLYREQVEVLDQISKEREAQRQSKLQSGEVQSRTDFEGTDLDPQNDRYLSAEAVKRFKYLDSFVREVFRFRQQKISLGHTAITDVVLSNGMVIHKGRKIVVNTRSLHQDYELQGEDPMEFRPWRFVGKVKSATKAAMDYLPFGVGKHACPGRFLAIQEIKTVTALLVTRYSMLELEDPSKKNKALFAAIGEPVPTGLYFTSRAGASVA